MAADAQALVTDEDADEPEANQLPALIAKEAAAVDVHWLRRAGRFTPEQRAAFLIAFAAGASFSKACDLAGTTPPTVRRALEKSPAFKAAYDEASERKADRLEDVIDGNAAKNIVAAFFLLKGMRPEKYREGAQVQINQQINVTGRLDAARQRLKSTRG